MNFNFILKLQLFVILIILTWENNASADSNKDDKMCGTCPCRILEDYVIDTIGQKKVPPPSLATFSNFKKGTEMAKIFEAAGIPSKDIGSGLYIFVYELSDGGTCTVGTSNYKGNAMYVDCK
jgi:hypothetical protein